MRRSCATTSRFMGDRMIRVCGATSTASLRSIPSSSRGAFPGSGEWRSRAGTASGCDSMTRHSTSLGCSCSPPCSSNSWPSL